MAPLDPVVQARGVTKWFGDVTALDIVDLVLPPGRVHGLLGPNGAGKTTLMAVLFGLVAPDEGEVRLFGATRAEAGRRWLAGVGGFVEAPRFYPYLSGRRNLAVLAGLDGGDAAGLVEPALEAVGLGQAARQKVRGYSLGMRQRLGLAAALVRRPRLLILDEPGNGLDPAGLHHLRAGLRQLAADGVSVLLSTHDVAHVEEVCDSVSVLDRGRVAFDGSLDDVRAASPEPTWRLATSDDASALHVAGQLDDLVVSAREGGGLRVVGGRRRMDNYVIGLGRAAIAVRELSQEASPLESFFFRLTGGPEEQAAPVAEAAATPPGVMAG